MLFKGKNSFPTHSMLPGITHATYILRDCRQQIRFLIIFSFLRIPGVHLDLIIQDVVEYIGPGTSFFTRLKKNEEAH